jgi:hypothetical protein
MSNLGMAGIILFWFGTGNFIDLWFKQGTAVGKACGRTSLTGEVAIFPSSRI